jgi:hypothetical protein
MRTYRKFREEEKIKRKQRFLSGADVGWTSLDSSDQALYSRRNGRSFRIVRDADKRWKLFRIVAQEDIGELLGVYGSRRDANKALDKIAYGPDDLRMSAERS